jgi:cell division protein FtsB
MKGLNFTWKYGLAIVAVAALAYLVMGFNSRMARLRQLRVQYDEVDATLQALKNSNAALQTQIAGATSDAPVRQWAYEEGRLIQPGDHPIVPLAPAETTPEPTPTPQAIQQPVKNWQMWLLLFVDSISP